jgi:hypothetical protein
MIGVVEASASDLTEERRMTMYFTNDSMLRKPAAAIITVALRPAVAAE